jgi:hypothetical protein
VLKPFKQSAGLQAKHTVAALYKNQMRLPYKWVMDVGVKPVPNAIQALA